MIKVEIYIAEIQNQIILLHFYHHETTLTADVADASSCAVAVLHVAPIDNSLYYIHWFALHSIWRYWLIKITRCRCLEIRRNPISEWIVNVAVIFLFLVHLMQLLCSFRFLGSVETEVIVSHAASLFTVAPVCRSTSFIGDLFLFLSPVSRGCPVQWSDT